MPKRTGISIKCPHCSGTGRIDLERMTLGDNIAARRKAAGLTQEDLSQKVLLSRAQVANIEGGRSDVPTKTLRIFATALGCSARDLIPA